MSNDLPAYIARLKSLNLEIRRRLELAELRVGSANLLLAQLAVTQLANDRIFLGDVILERAYSVRSDPSGSGQVIQAAISIQGGFGAVFWDSEDFYELSGQPMFESEAMMRRVPFSQCGPAIKGLLLGQLEPLLGELLASLGRI